MRRVRQRGFDCPWTHPALPFLSDLTGQSRCAAVRQIAPSSTSHTVGAQQREQCPPPILASPRGAVTPHVSPLRAGSVTGFRAPQLESRREPGKGPARASALGLGCRVPVVRGTPPPSLTLRARGVLELEVLAPEPQGKARKTGSGAGGGLGRGRRLCRRTRGRRRAFKFGRAGRSALALQPN